jgi:hypothetical protein
VKGRRLNTIITYKIKTQSKFLKNYRFNFQLII